MTSSRHRMNAAIPSLARRLRAATAACASLAALALSGCDGSNAFGVDPAVQPTGKDTRAPTVVVDLPSDASAAVAVGDSLFTRVRVSDNRALRSLTISAFSLRGNAALGTQTQVARFQSKTVRLDSIGRAVTDTTITRFLMATADSVPDQRVYVVATAQDTAGNVGADTAFVSIVSGPRVALSVQPADSVVRAGRQVRVRVTATDSLNRVSSVRVRASGAFLADTTVTFATAIARVDTAVTLNVPVTAEGTVRLDATATSAGTARLVGTSATVSVRSVVPPTVKILDPQAGTTVAVGDSVLTRVRVSDNLAVRSLSLSGFALRGDPALGTQVKVTRFQTKTVRLDSIGRAITDTTITRFLLPAQDSIPESRVYVVATAQDTAGNVTADTTIIGIGGPRVQIVSPRADSTFRAGAPLTVRLSAEDQVDRISSLRLRSSGAFGVDTTLTFRVPPARVDTSVVLAIPTGAQGDLQLDAVATSTQRIQGIARPVRVRVLAASQDVLPPRVSFSPAIPARMEVTDSLAVTVSGTDDTRLDTLGVTLLAIRHGATRDDTLGVLSQRARVSPPVSSQTFRFGLGGLSLTGLDTLTISFEVVGFAKDAAGNCATASAPNTQQSLPCRTGFRGATLADAPGAVSNVTIVRGRTVALATPGDTIADIASDGFRVFASNRPRNRVEVLPIGSTQFAAPIQVGSQPWGLAIGRNNATLLVANSGGAGSISQVPISPTSVPASEDESRRIVTQNAVLYVVRFSVDQSGRTTLVITVQDFSDRPQYLAEMASGRVLYSTVPTAAAPDGTVQEYNPNGPEAVTQLFLEYARGSVPGTFVINRADAVTKFIRGSGESATEQLVVCDHVPGQPRSSLCFPRRTSDTLSFQQIQDSLRVNGADAVLDFSIDPSLIGLSDTTFAAVSKDLKTAAFGEGARQLGRVMAFREDGAGNIASIGDTRDLVDNASDRVVGLALNTDGSVGVARGNATYFFNQGLRKLGRVATGLPTGGVALHPNHPSVRIGFISGVDETGRPFVDVVDTFFFRNIRRMYIRDVVTGPLIATLSGGTVRLYAVTARGIVGIDLTAADLQ